MNTNYEHAKRKRTPGDLLQGEVKTGRVDVRLAAVVLDFFMGLMFSFSCVVSGLVVYFIALDIATNGDNAGYEGDGGEIIFALYGFYLLYHFLGWLFWEGQTFGKWTMGLCLVDANTLRRPNLKGAFLRTLGYALNWFFPPLWGLPLITQQRRGLQDYLAGTVIVHKDTLPDWLDEDIPKRKRG